ncbi:hypothetical protein CCB80_13790 [Armatimonadetes bacterium Uphvl-Ar1]|nr:hypothetical protein CCB80_13790 [Armatimonadetes bacterium Uphvl-Ar1]
MILPTTRLWIAFGLGILIALGGMVAPGLEQFVLPYNIFLVILWYLTGRLAKKWDVVRITRQTDPVLSVRVKNTITLNVENNLQIPITIQIRDEVPENSIAEGNEFRLKLSGRSKKSHSYRLTPTSRGEWEFRGTYIRYPALLGLAQIEKQILPPNPVRIYPNVKAIEEFELLKQSGHLNHLGMRQSRQKGLGMEFESLRDYNDDDFRKIDWKASARRNKLVVRNFEQETNQGVVVCVDVGRHMLGEVEGVRKLDHCLDTALLFIHAAQRAGDQVGLMLFDDSVQNYIAPRRGKAQVARVLEALYDAQAQPVQPNYNAAFSFLATRWKKRSLVVIFTDAENADQAAVLTTALAQIRRRHLVYVVRVSDPKLREFLNAEVTGEQELFDQAAALWYIGDRKRAEIALRNAGINSLEAEPQDLARQLVTAYLRVKRLSLI